MCDTNGATLPAQVAAAVADVHAALGGDVALGIHTHNDAECAVANSLAAVEAGARLVQGTLNGYGERCGNANLIAIIPSLEIKLGYACIGPERLARLSQISHEAAEICNLQPDAHAAYVGRSAFAHKGGMHVAGMQADVRTFEHIDPAVVGNSRTVLVSELSGKGTVREKAAEFGVELDPAGVDRALERLKVLEHRGYAFEAADASFELLLRTEAGEIEPLFELEALRVITEKRADGRVETEATIKLRVRGERVVQTAEGNGPVNALDTALRTALTGHYPELGRLELANYKVRILNPHSGTGAVTRVILDTSDGHHEWATVGVSPNIIEASWEALVESLTVRRAPAPDGARGGVMPDGDGPVAARFEERMRAEEERRLAPRGGALLRHAWPGRARGGVLAPHAVPARPRPHHPRQGVPAPQAQDAGLHRAGGRPLPHAAHAHARGRRDRALGGARAAAERGPDRGDRARARPRTPAVRPRRRGGAVRRARGRARSRASATTSTRCGSSSTWSATAAG